MNVVKEKVQQLCYERGWTVRQLEEKSGLSKDYMGRLTSVGAFPSLENLYKICEVFQISVPEFLEAPYLKNLSAREEEFLETYNNLYRHKGMFHALLEGLSQNETCIQNEDRT